MKILRLNAYYTPEVTAGSHLINDLCEGLANEKIYCEIITPTPCRGVTETIRKEYKKRKIETSYNGYITIKRFSMFREGKNPILRALRYFLCSIMQFWKGIHSKNIDIVFSSSTPPTQGMLSALVAKRLSKRYKQKVSFVYNLQDVFPDSLVNSGMTHEGSLIWKIGRKIENYTYKNADRIIVISKSMEKNIINKGVPTNKIEVVTNWIDAETVTPIPKNQNVLYDRLELSQKDFIVVYAGNLGEAQGAEIILDVARELKNYTSIKFVVFGGGTYFDKIKKDSELMGNVVVKKLLPQQYVSQVYSLGDVALITCKPGTGNAGMPSKTWSIMACNTPIIASFDQNSELDRILHESKTGICVTPGNIQELSDAIIYQFEHRNHTNDYRQYVLENATKKNCVSKYTKIFKDEVERSIEND